MIDTNCFGYEEKNIWAAAWQNNKMACVPSEDSDRPGHPTSLIRVCAVHMKKAWVLSFPLSAHRRLWSDWADAQTVLSLRWAHSHFTGFVVRRLICLLWQSILIHNQYVRIHFRVVVLNSLLFERTKQRDTCQRSVSLEFHFRYPWYDSDMVLIWATRRQNVCLGVSDQARHKPACAATEAS